MAKESPLQLVFHLQDLRRKFASLCKDVDPSSMDPNYIARTQRTLLQDHASYFEAQISRQLLYFCTVIHRARSIRNDGFRNGAARGVVSIIHKRIAYIGSVNVSSYYRHLSLLLLN